MLAVVAVGRHDHRSRDAGRSQAPASATQRVSAGTCESQGKR